MWQLSGECALPLLSSCTPAVHVSAHSDALVETDTVREAIYFSAAMRLPARTKAEERDAIVDSVIQVCMLVRAKEKRRRQQYARVLRLQELDLQDLQHQFIGSVEQGGLPKAIRKKVCHVPLRAPCIA